MSLVEKNKELLKKAGKKRSKYGSRKVIVDDLFFASKKEAEYYGKLKLMQKAGLISPFVRQVSFELNPGGTHSVKYIADFLFTDLQTGERKVVDVKGYRTKIYRKKAKLMLQVHNIEIMEV